MKYSICCTFLLIVYVIALCVNSVALYNWKLGHHFRRWDELNVTHNVSTQYYDVYYDDIYYTPKEYRKEKKSLMSSVDSDFEMIWNILFFVISYIITKNLIKHSFFLEEFAIFKNNHVNHLFAMPLIT